jgi:molecular chaperone DnaK (HSP70)
MDYYGTLTVIALDKQTGRRETISVVTMSDSYDTPQILRMIEDKDTYEADDLIMVEKTKKMIEEGKWEGKDGELKRVYERRTHDEL